MSVKWPPGHGASLKLNTTWKLLFGTVSKYFILSVYVNIFFTHELQTCQIVLYGFVTVYCGLISPAKSHELK
jgi:hypothetical protein